MCRLGRRGVIVILVSFLFGLRFGGANARFFKCCSDGFVLDDNLDCGKIHDNAAEALSAFGNGTSEVLEECPNGIHDNTPTEANGTGLACRGVLVNGTVVTLSCDKMLSNQTHGHCDSPFKLLNFWGATIVVSATMIYTLPYLLVVIVYCSYADLRKRAFDKSLICYNSSYAILNLMLITMGFFELCHRELPDFVYGICGSVIVYFIQASCLWLFILCFDMTLVITRFRWAPSSDSKTRSENRKFKVYSMLNWGLSVVPAVIVVTTEFAPSLPKDSPVRANFSNFHGPPNKSLLIYSLTVPVLTLLTNTILFVYTSYRMVKVKKDNRILNQNNVRNAKKEYFVYLKLYIIMDAPWLTGALSAIYPSLWILKFFRVIQPILMLYIILPKKRILKTIGCIKNSAEREAEDCLRDRHDPKDKKCDAHKPLNGDAMC
ncbi:G-protein coupled receptor Mth2 [Diachasma alloeum]|uniref:G-protein coupled receptor Mth2 n=1 Tax=Diachasma alloeum TaxID=454923 RepID=UPI0007383289|nr:G-protein coupled receptor Mth2 [Diachasma alloeum]